MASSPEVQAYHIRQAYIEVLKKGYLIKLKEISINKYMISVMKKSRLGAYHRFTLEPF